MGTILLKSKDSVKDVGHGWKIQSSNSSLQNLGGLLARLPAFVRSAP